jgi:hypothetical protein
MSRRSVLSLGKTSGRQNRVGHFFHGKYKAVLVECGMGTIREMRKRTGRDVTALSSAVKRLQMISKTALDLVERMKRLLEAYSKIANLQAPKVCSKMGPGYYALIFMRMENDRSS